MSLTGREHTVTTVGFGAAELGYPPHPVPWIALLSVLSSPADPGPIFKNIFWMTAFRRRIRLRKAAHPLHSRHSERTA